MIRAARPAPRAHVKLVRGIIVFVLDLPFVDTAVHPAHFLPVHHRAVIPIVCGDQFHVPVRVNGHPIENVIVQLHAKTRLADGGGGIIRRMVENGIGVDA